MTDHEDEGDARARPTCESNNNTAAISNGTVDTSRLKSEKDDNRTNPKKRGMKPRSQRNRKRPRGGIGCLVGDKDDGNNENTDQNSETTIHDQSPSTILRIDVVPLSKAFEMISGMKMSKKGHPEEPTINTKNIDHHEKVHDQRRVRIIHPYPYTFATFAKSRWINRTVVDIYHEEFGSYPKTYYEAAIKAGRILVSGKRVNCDYKVKGGDELTHAVHRHEPAVGLADNVKFGILSDGEKEAAPPPIHIVHEDESLLIVDKPATLPIHPCGGYNYNSLFEILSHWKPQLYGSGKLFTIHRLDRLTSGLVLVAKSSALARSLGKCIMERDGCEKIYLTRVKGKFPLNLQQVGHGKKVEKVEIGTEVRNDKHHPWRFQKCDHGEIESGCSSSIPPPCMNGEFTSECNEKVWKGGLKFSIPSFDGNKKRGKNNKASSDLDQRSKDSIAALGYWITNEDDSIIENASLQQLFDQSSKMSMEEILATATSSRPENDTGDETISDIAFTRMPIRWLNFACPCRVSSHKNGICEAGDFSHLINDFGDKSNANNGQENSSQPGKGIKPAQTSFTLLSYDASTNTSLVLAKPITGRTHQIRLHAQALGHPIANDHCYGGELWCGDEQGKEACRKSRDWLDRLDRGDIDIGSSDYGTATAREESNGTSGARIAPENSTISDVPATEAEIYHAAANRSRADGESILEFIEKTCVWCARCRGVAEIGHWDKCHGEVDEEKLRQEQQSAVFRRTLMEYLVRSQGIWLHALQYSLKTMDEQGREKTLRYRTRLPFWAVPLQAANLCCDK